MESTDIELDDRMTDECKKFVTALLKMSKPSDILKIDLKLARRLKDEQALKLNQFFDFDELKIEDFKVVNENDAYEITVRSYEPKVYHNATGKSKSLTVFMHGGGYSIGSVTTHNHSVGLLALKSNSVWLSIDYRKCPEFRYPVPYTDCMSVMRWAMQHARERFNLSDEYKFGIAGDSSGGQMAAELAHELKNKLDYQILVYPVVHYGGKYESYGQFTKDCYLITPTVAKFFVSNLTAGGDSTVHTAQLSPINRSDFTNLPQCLIVAVELDPVVDDSRKYHEKLVENKIPCRLYVIKGTVHGYFSQPLHFKDAFTQTTQHIVEFLNQVAN